MVNRRFDGIRPATPAFSPGPSRTGRPCSRLWAIVVLLAVPFYMFSQKELAPMEDQGVVFGVRPGLAQLHPRPDASSTPRRSTTCTSRSRRRATRSRSRPRAAASAGMVTKPWSERKKTTEQLLLESAGKLVGDPRRAGHPADARAPARRRRLPRGLRGRLHRRAGAARRDRGPARGEGVPERALHLRRLRPEVRPAPDRGGLQPRQGALAGSRPEPGRPRPRHDARRRLRQPLQHPGAQLQGHPPGEARRAAHRRAAHARST